MENLSPVQAIYGVLFYDLIHFMKVLTGNGVWVISQGVLLGYVHPAVLALSNLHVSESYCIQGM